MRTLLVCLLLFLTTTAFAQLEWTTFVNTVLSNEGITPADFIIGIGSVDKHDLNARELARERAIEALFKKLNDKDRDILLVSDASQNIAATYSTVTQKPRIVVEHPRMMDISLPPTYNNTHAIVVVNRQELIRKAEVLRTLSGTEASKDRSTFAVHVTAENGIDTVSINGETAIASEDDIFYATLQLAHGRNAVVVDATAKNDISIRSQFTLYRAPAVPSASETVVGQVDTHPNDALIDRTNKDFALFFATDRYSGEKDATGQWGNLNSSIRGAEAISKNLQDNYGFQTRIFPNLKKRELLETLYAYTQNFGGIEYVSGSQLLIFFSGHAHYDRTREKGYLITADTDYHNAGDPAMVSAIPYSQLREDIDAMKCPRILVLMDTSFSGPFIPELGFKSIPPLRGGPIHSYEQQLKAKLKLRARWCLTAAGVEYVADGATGQSPFASAFLSALDTKGGADAVLTLDEVWQAVEKSKDDPIYDKLVKQFRDGFTRPQPRKGRFGESFEESDFLFFPIVQKSLR